MSKYVTISGINNDQVLIRKSKIFLVYQSEDDNCTVVRIQDGNQIGECKTYMTIAEIKEAIENQ